MRLLTTIITTLALSNSFAFAETTEKKRPNLIFILVDDFGAMDISMAGSLKLGLSR